MTESPSRPLLEVACEGVESAVNAAEGGADRVELCADLEVGGVTPSRGTIERARAELSCALFVLVRPRAGGFVYTHRELDVLLRDVEAAREAGADGVVTGVLDRDGSVDTAILREVLDRARPLAVTFHRAFDLLPDALAGLEILAEAGVDRVLTAGGARTAAEGAERIRELVGRAGSRVAVVAGGGVDDVHARAVVTAAGVDELHVGSSVEEAVGDPTAERVPLGPGGRTVSRPLRQVDAGRVRRIVEILQRPR